MSVFSAKTEHIPGLVAMGKKFHAMSPHRGMGEYDALAMSRVIRFMIESDHATVLTNGTGVIGGVLSPVYFNPSVLQLEESFWWAKKGGGELLTALEEWGIAKGAQYIMLSTLENKRALVIDRVIRRRGYKMLERRYSRELTE